jgi:DNA-binding HxlR family transcriptional regulator
VHGQLPGGAEYVPGYSVLATVIGRTLAVLGDRWTLLIVEEALRNGSTRFGDFHRALRIPTNILTRRLQAMTQAGLLERADAPLGRSPHEYRLTDRGRDLSPILDGLHKWGSAWLVDTSPTREVDSTAAQLPSGIDSPLDSQDSSACQRSANPDPARIGASRVLRG